MGTSVANLTVQQATDALNDLGGPDEIAAYLITHNYHGPRKMAAKCPVSRYIVDVTREAWVSVGHNWITAPSTMTNSGNDSVQIPQDVKTFINRFDRGDYTDLINYHEERKLFGALDVSGLGGETL